VLDELSWRVAQGQVDLPLLPGVAMEVTNVVARESADARAIAELLRKDQAMAAHVLRVVASPVYSGRGQIVSLQQAVARLMVFYLPQQRKPMCAYCACVFHCSKALQANRTEGAGSVNG
jgi:c-di-GMP-related signal transduction protein